MPRRPAFAIALAAMAAGALSACSNAPKAPADAGVCWQMVTHGKSKPPTYNKVADHVPAIENCAANLEAMRIKFLTLGGSHSDINGAYQGTFIFINREGVYTSDSWNATPYLALVRSGDGRLVVPGAMPQQQQQQ